MNESIEGSLWDSQLVDLLLLYRLTRSTGIQISTLQKTDATEVEVMLSLQEARSKFYLGKLQEARAGEKSAEVLTVLIQSILVEEKFSI